MPEFLTALSKTSLLFWKDRDALTWQQATVLFVTLLGSTQFAQYGHAGGAPFMGARGALLLLQVVLALVMAFGGRRLGQAAIYGPSLIRLLSVALVLGSMAIASNGMYAWTDHLPDLPRFLGRATGMKCLASGLLSTLVLVVHTKTNYGESDRFPWRKTLTAAFLVCATTSVLLYWAVIPQM